MIQINLTNSQSVITNCSFSDDCVSPLTSSFTQDCSAGRLKQYARCLSNQSCLNPETAGTQLNEHYCDSEEYGCSISCIGKTYIYACMAKDEYYRDKPLTLPINHFLRQ